MNALAIGLYGAFLIAVGFAGNSSALIEETKKDIPGFIPWAVAIAVLAVMNDHETTKDIVGPFMTLLIITFVVKNYETLRTQFNQLSQMATGATS